ncbi:hypothetical protein GCM10011380_35410 [Sphingomonas metalli]|uniref:AtuA-like ferredoxin-fold domain-containing protein n=1 Tax=Sphingomonas metalli TaxID=1779358 RepID=A0A916THZ8_9SPHN|nr:hypothetical protein [Sphingomonas metalli]GGB42853.1 hypothetical protein GCM10011380_35410 [Sphingomonas metalli]
MQLGDIAHLRTGDKGDISQVSVIAYDPADYALLLREVTVDRVLTHLATLTVRRATRYELPGLGALNFVLEGALNGGVTRSLALDAHGKSLGAQLLDLPLRGTIGDPS